MDFVALRVGTTLHFGTYLIKKVLGQGGFGITYLGYDTKLEKEVAIKEFFPSALCSRDDQTNHITIGTQTSEDLVYQLKEKFLKEARNIAKLNHPNIIKIFTAFEEFNTAYYVMEYIKGESLDQRVVNYGPMVEDYAIRYINPIGHALEYLHANHMMHFDVKPANIMVRSSDNCPILIDFGLSKNYDSSGHQTTIHGPLGVSPGYSPVEQYNMSGSAQFTPKSDLYSLAATMYFLLTGNHPSEATTNPAASLTFPANVKSNVRNAIVSAMSMSADRRQDSVAEFLREINNPNPGVNAFRQAADTQISQSTRIETPVNNSHNTTKTNNNSSPKNILLICIICILVIVCGFCIYAIMEQDNGYKGSSITFSDNSTGNDYATQKEEITVSDSTPATDSTPAESQEESASEESSLPSYGYGFNTDILNSPSRQVGGKTCHFYKGIFSLGGQSWPIMIAFIESGNRITYAYYKNIKYKALIKMRLDISNGYVSMSGDSHDGNFYINLDTDNDGNFYGEASSGDKTFSVDLYPTTETFSF